MCDMYAPRLPIPNPDEWGTRHAVAAHLNVDVVTVSRMATSGRLTPHWPRRGPGESRRTLFWWPEVEAYAQARLIAQQGVGA